VQVVRFPHWGIDTALDSALVTALD
jgi:hypothetical protein